MSDLHTMTVYIMVELTFLSEPLCPSVLRRHHIRRRKQSSFLAAVRIPVPAENAPKNEAKILVKLSFADKSRIYPVFTQPTKSKYSHRKSVIGYGWEKLERRGVTCFFNANISTFYCQIPKQNVKKCREQQPIPFTYPN